MKLYVGNLPWSIDDSGLKELFSSYSVEEANLIKDKYSGRSKGFGFITISDEESAKKAIEEMHEKDIQGRKLTVSEARPMVQRDSPRGESRDEPAEEAPEADSDAVNDSTEDAIEADTEEADAEAEKESEAESEEVEEEYKSY